MIHEVLEAIYVGTGVATFLLNTSRVLKAIELCKECLILVNNKALKDKAFILAYIEIHRLMLKGYYLIHDHKNGIECGRRFLLFLRAGGKRAIESKVTFDLAKFYHHQSKYKEAEEDYKTALSIAIETGERKGEASCYGSLGSVYLSLGDCVKAEEYQQKALVIIEEIGDPRAKAACFGNLGAVYESLGEYGKAEEYQKKALVINQEIGDQNGEATCCGHLGIVHLSLGEYSKAEEYQRKALVINQEIGNREGEAACYGNLGVVYQALGKYGKAEEYQKKELVIRQETGVREGEARCYGNLGNVYHSLGEHDKAKEYHKKALVINKEIGHRKGEAACYANLGIVYHSLQYKKAEEYLKKALVIRQEIGGRKGEAACYGDLGSLYFSLGEHAKAEEYQNKALVIRKDIGDKRGEAACYGNIGNLFRFLGVHAKAKDYHEKAVTISREIGDIASENAWYLQLAFDILAQRNTCLEHEAFSNLFASIQKCEEMRSFLQANEQFKISLLDRHIASYNLLSALFCVSGKHNDALYVEELGRARALADVISARYSVKQQISVSPQEWVGIERTMRQENNCSCLYISYYNRYMCMWVLKGNKPILFRRTDVNECFVSKGLERTVDEVFSEESALRKFHVLHKGDCEDRSLFPSDANHSAGQSSQRENMEAVRLVEEESEEDQQPVPTLAECYNMIIAPVADLLDKPELIIVPDSCLYKVPFAALKDESDKYLSESFRIRIVPSLNILKLIRDSPADYHSQTGALIVGEPDVSEVLYKGRVEKLCPLPCARREAEMIGRLLGAEPLRGNQATKGAVLQGIQSVSLIHFAAHGNAERGEIALAPQQPINGIPREEDYLLTMADISKVQLRAKLVVLSCCHSASGRVRAEGVIGIARAFLGSGARSVLVALWALEDSATEQLMSRFYEHLVRGESASGSLHQAMKWMRSNGYSDMRDWAPFMLIGDNVTFIFGK